MACANYEGIHAADTESMREAQGKARDDLKFEI
jgi:hypothetical protein